MLSFLLGLQLVTTLFLVGLIWTVQIVSYPLFAFVPPRGADSYHAEHVRRITWVVAGPMLIELSCAVLLLVLSPGLLSGSGAALVLIVWLSTVVLQVPAHGRLTSEFDQKEVAQLVQSNWIRTIAWTMRGVVVVAMFVDR